MTSGKGAINRLRRRSHTPIGHVAVNIASASSTIVGPGATATENDSQALSSRPPTDATHPTAIAPNSVTRKERASCCEVATGTTISAETSSSPTVRIATVMLTAASTAMSRFHARTRRPATRAKSWSLATANSWGDSPTATTSTTAVSAPVNHTSEAVIALREPKRYAWRVAAPSPAMPVIRTPPARPP